MQDHIMLSYQSDALANPRAVVIESIDAVVTDNTVTASWWTVYLTYLTIFNLHRDTFNADPPTSGDDVSCI